MRLYVTLPDKFGYPIAANELAEYIEEMFPNLSAEWYWDDEDEARFGATVYGVRVEGHLSDEGWHELLTTMACHCLKRYGAISFAVDG